MFQTTLPSLFQSARCCRRTDVGTDQLASRKVQPRQRDPAPLDLADLSGAEDRMPGGYAFSAVGSHAPDAGGGMGPLADASPVMAGGGTAGPARSAASPTRTRLLSGLASNAERVATIAARMKNTTTCQ